MKALRLLTSFNKTTPSLLSQTFAAFSSSSSAANPRFSNFCFDDDDDQKGSRVYQHKLKFQRPTTITWPPWRYDLGNSASFIGSVDSHLRIVNNGTGGRFGISTLFRVRNSPKSYSNFWILLKMWDEMAALSFKHLKPNDFIYVSGCLGSYSKADENGNCRLYYELIVKELNYVAQHRQGSSSKSYKEPQSDGGGADLEKHMDCLYLWQVFLRNPHEWWDNRKDKLNPRQPDFKHKDTGEALWLSPDDPPWIKRQLELLDMRMAEQGYGQQGGFRSRVSKWEYDE